MNMKLTADGAQAILDRILAGESQKALAAEFKISASAISNLVAGKSWPALTRPRHTPPPQHGTTLTSGDVLEILQRLLGGEKPKTVAEAYGVTRQSIVNIQKNRTWRHIPRPEATRLTRRRVWET